MRKALTLAAFSAMLSASAQTLINPNQIRQPSSPLITWTNATGAGGWIGQNGASTPTQIYQSGQEQFNLHANDGIQGVSTIPNTSTEWEGGGVFGGVQNASTTTNAVAGRFYGLATGPGVNDANRVKIWGINTLLKDGSLATNFANVLLINEWDFNVNNASTKVISHSIGGASSVQPVSALGYLVNTIGGAGTTIKWDFGFGSLDGATNTFASIGTRDLISTSTTSASQNLLFFSRAASVVRSATINLDSTGILYIAPQLAAGGVTLQDGAAGNILAVASGHATIGGPLVLAQYSAAGLPAAASHSGGVVVCVACTASSTPCSAGGANVMARSTGAQWNCGSF